MDKRVVIADDESIIRLDLKEIEPRPERLDGLVIGAPAVGGVLIGAWLQQRLAGRSIMLLFAAVLVAAAVELLLE